MSSSAIVAVKSLLSPAPSLATDIFDPFVLLTVFVLVPGLSVSGNPRVRFNNDSGTTAYAYSVSDNVAAPVTGIAGAASGILLSAVSATTPVVSQLIIGNGPLQAHAIMLRGSAGILDASAAPHFINGAAAWATTSQITSIQIDAGPGGGNLNAGTGILVVGVNP
jgi:hypothetical protein